MAGEMYVLEVDQSAVSAFAKVTPPEGYKEVSRVYDLGTNRLLKVFFEKDIDA